MNIVRSLCGSTYRAFTGMTDTSILLLVFSLIMGPSHDYLWKTFEFLLPVDVAMLVLFLALFTLREFLEQRLRERRRRAR